jgi:hypothetical protein
LETISPAASPDPRMTLAIDPAKASRPSAASLDSAHALQRLAHDLEMWAPAGLGRHHPPSTGAVVKRGRDGRRFREPAASGQAEEYRPGKDAPPRRRPAAHVEEAQIPTAGRPGASLPHRDGPPPAAKSNTSFRATRSCRLSVTTRAGASGGPRRAAADAHGDLFEGGSSARQRRQSRIGQPRTFATWRSRGSG